MRSIVIHYQEIALKGKNRPWFISRLVRQVKLAMADLDVREVQSIMGRIEVVLGPEAPWEIAKDRLQHVFGIANFAVARRTPPDLDVLTTALLSDLEGLTPKNFRVAARRADKRFPMPSPEVERLLGARVQAAFGWPVKLDDPDFTIRIELVTHEAFYSFGKDPGAGGLPTGRAARLACLLSGGIDSPVAAYRMMRRGCTVMFIHSTATRFCPARRRRRCARSRRCWRGISCASASAGAVRRAAAAGGARRSAAIAGGDLPPADDAHRRAARAHVGARALVTGEVVGQVASQTLENMTVIAAATRLPILRPLVGMDKDEITAEAERIGTLSHLDPSRPGLLHAVHAAPSGHAGPAD